VSKSGWLLFLTPLGKLAGFVWFCLPFYPKVKKEEEKNWERVSSNGVGVRGSVVRLCAPRRGWNPWNKSGSEKRRKFKMRGEGEGTMTVRFEQT
jgi:hypothetical protein